MRKLLYATAYMKCFCFFQSILRGSLLSGILPVHPQRQPGELLSSWLVRLARANAMKLRPFTKIVTDDTSVWNRDIDKSATPDLLHRLADRTGRPPKEVRRATLKGAYEGRLYDNHTASGHQRWILPTGVYHRARRLHGLLYCPFCLKEKPAYFRHRWRLAFVTVCSEHGVDLWDRCPGCGAPVAFHRGAFADRNRRNPHPITRCAECRSDLREAQPRFPDHGEQPARFQRRLLSDIQTGISDIPGWGRVYSHLFFDGLYQLVKIIGFNRRGESFRRAVQEASGRFPPPEEEPGDQVRGQGIEGASLAWRRHVIALLGWLMEEWPRRFLDAAWEGGLTRSCAMLHLGKAGSPYWYERLCKDRLEGAPYSPTEREILSAQAFLAGHGQPCNPHAVSRALGLRGTSKKVNCVLREVGNG